MAEDAVLDRRRAQLGASIGGLAAGERGVSRSGDGWWLVLSGAPSADNNTGAVFSRDAEVLRAVVAEIERSGLPTELLTAGDAPDHLLPPPWRRTGTMPFMAVDLRAAPRSRDARVRRAAASDHDTVVDLLVETYELPTDVVTDIVAPVLAGADAMGFCVLEDGGRAVSTAMAARHEDVVTLWCMATSPPCRRRGFGSALLAHVLAEAAADGAAVGLLGASPDGEALYRSAGWVTLEDWRVHGTAPPDDDGS
jgi:ribosomal protein S18 acetylase RimI-like enzyme